MASKQVIASRDKIKAGKARKKSRQEMKAANAPRQRKAFLSCRKAFL